MIEFWRTPHLEVEFFIGEFLPSIHKRKFVRMILNFVIPSDLRTLYITLLNNQGLLVRWLSKLVCNSMHRGWFYFTTPVLRACTLLTVYPKRPINIRTELFLLLYHPFAGWFSRLRSILQPHVWQCNNNILPAFYFQLSQQRTLAMKMKGVQVMWGLAL